MKKRMIFSAGILTACLALVFGVLAMLPPRPVTKMTAREAINARWAHKETSGDRLVRQIHNVLGLTK